MEIPIFENDERVGTLRASVQGLYTLFAARLPPAAGADVPDGPSDMVLSRLWLVNRNGYAGSLGLLAPCESGRLLSRRLTRLECSRLPSAPVKAVVLPNGEKPFFSSKKKEKAKTGFAWRSLSDGSLIDANRRLLALPWAGEKLPLGACKIVYHGMEYWVFRY